MDKDKLRDSSRWKYDVTNDTYRCSVCRIVVKGDVAPTCECDEVRKEAQPELPGVESTLAERGKRYGDFERQANAIQRIKRILFPSDGPAIGIPDDCRQAAEMIVVKLVRAMLSDPAYTDNWHDMAGYARLVERRLENSKASLDHWPV